MVVSHWITCGSSQDADQEGEMGLGRYLELLRTLERKKQETPHLNFPRRTSIHAQGLPSIQTLGVPGLGDCGTSVLTDKNAKLDSK